LTNIESARAYGEYIEQMNDLQRTIEDAIRTTGFSGIVHANLAPDIRFSAAYGMSDRAHQVPVTLDTIFSVASVTKSLTALVTMKLFEAGSLSLDTTARSILGPDLPMVDDRVNIRHLLCHRSGIGDYINESDVASVDDYVMNIPVHRLDSSEAYLEVLDGFEQRFSPDDHFEYCNSGYAVLAILAERATTADFANLLAQLVTVPADMASTGLVRMDELPASIARGYLHSTGLRSNTLHLPVLGSGDGGAFSNLRDIQRLWTSLFEGRVVSEETRAAMIEPYGHSTQMRCAYGLGFWLPDSSDAVMMEGADAGVSIRSVHWPRDGSSFTVISNTSVGAWPLVRIIEQHLAT
jgi:CubicO group peptidase (beta-lactamase class C family)